MSRYNFDRSRLPEIVASLGHADAQLLDHRAKRRSMLRLRRRRRRRRRSKRDASFDVHARRRWRRCRWSWRRLSLNKRRRRWRRRLLLQLLNAFRDVAETLDGDTEFGQIATLLRHGALDASYARRHAVVIGVHSLLVRHVVKRHRVYYVSIEDLRARSRRTRSYGYTFDLDGRSVSRTLDRDSVEPTTGGRRVLPARRRQATRRRRCRASSGWSRCRWTHRATDPRRSRRSCR